MEKRFDPTTYERRWQRFWRENDTFRAPTGDEDSAETFCIMIPPPNVTGRLHMGHALQSALQDLMIRWKRMQGFNALWLPGTDHAGIATQLMVERQLESEGASRAELGRERFVERVWEWKERYHSNIREQLELLGSSCDWSRERFTMDEGLSVAVRSAFVTLYNKGLISRGEYIVNWSPVLQTAISDLEVEMKTVQGKLYHLKYPVEDSDEQLVVATTRPETMLGDTAVAAHPEDDRFRHLIGRLVVLPLVGRRIPIIADSHVDPEFGTGLVKITPFHDPNDFEIAQRHGLDGVQVIDLHGKMTAAAGADFEGLDRFVARDRVIAALREQGLLQRIDDHEHTVGHSQRSGEPVEPMVSLQWFCDMESMAQRALQSVERGDLRLVPDSWEKTWAHWLTNIRPWVISRQLWWGHRIPAWYDEQGECYVAMDRAEAERLAGTSELRQDSDVLDTWFSSGLWPMSTLGWPDTESADYRTFYPTDVMITGFDILFFWVARMVMMGLELSESVPFHTVHLTGLVRDADGEKMSKTKGNTVDPLELVKEYGADAVRFTLCALDSPGRDIPLDRERMAGYRAFGNKIWNATRFALSRIGDATARAELDPSQLEAPERWILSRLSYSEGYVNDRFESFRFDEACHRLYHFFWGELCDWYIELAKPALSGDQPRPLVGEVLATVLDRSLRLLHPVMPHLTEELWQRLPRDPNEKVACLSLAAFPQPVDEWRDEKLEAELGALFDVIGRIRSLRSERQVDRRARCRLFLESGDETARGLLLAQRHLIEALAQLQSVAAEAGPEGCLRDRVAGVDIALEVERQQLGEGERDRLEREVAKLDGEIRSAQQRLANPQFVERAPQAIVDGNRARLEELQERRRRVVGQLDADNALMG